MKSYKIIFLSLLFVFFAAPSYGEEGFIKPVLLWEREFDPPLIDISDQNSSGEYIVIQGGGKEGRPTKILFLDSKGKTVREMPLGKKEKRKIPAKEVWLTYYGNRWNNEKFKRSFSEGGEINTEIYRAYISGSGEYYGIVTKDIAYECAGPEQDCYGSPWYEFAYYDRTGKLLWKIVPDDNYGFSRAVVSYDGSRIMLIDEAILDYFGQRWYLYDNEGKLLKTEDHNLMGKGEEEREKEYGEWIMDDYGTVSISPSTKYIASVNGADWTQSKISLRDGEGKLLWSKKFDEKGHSYVEVSEQGTLIIGGRKASYLVNREGKVILNRGGYFSKSGNYILAFVKLDEGWDILRVFETTSGKLNLNVKASKILNVRDIRVLDKKFLSDKYLIFVYSGPPTRGQSIGVLDIEKKKIVWKRKNIGTSILVRHTNSKRLMLGDSSDYSTRMNKVIVFDLTGGKSHEE